MGLNERLVTIGVFVALALLAGYNYQPVGYDRRHSAGSNTA
jgi:hypothetical protein